ncbi:TetR/AcrR family transcriptional regulator [Corynebacterium oculi]|uniref:HTH-type transcriptional regulator BetI n=1 Tax=Corynebacterium oculi TaxID=1544416 RepID=A0A0Q0U9U1_9CORY|nr:TetR family transcriptional regulator [Corynebacterium oculi]KQB84508.1 HTH-type transcriptional regulator BetI [Corynebacterium oculi]
MTRTGERTGRRPGNPDTRAHILEVARSQFAAKGFRGTTTRAIAEEAGVNVALLPHYFGNKKKLFAATLELPGTVEAKIREALKGDWSGAGERLARAYLALWEDEATRTRLIAGARAAMSSEHAMESIRTMLVGVLADEGEGRAEAIALAMTQLLGAALLRHVSKIPAIVDMPFDRLVERVSLAVQLHLSE